MKKNNIARNLPRVTNTGNSTLNMWLTAAEEIIKDIRQRIAQLEGNKSSNPNNPGSGESIIKLPNLGDYERKDNKVQSIDANVDGKEQYPSVFALRSYVTKAVQGISEQNVFEEWEINVTPFESLGARNGDMFKIMGDGTHGTLELRNGDVVQVYDDEDEDLKLLVIIDSRNIMAGVHTTDVLDEGDEHLYFTVLRVLQTKLENLVESTEEIDANDSILTSLGKAKGRINHLQQVLSFLEFESNQKITDMNLDLDAIHLSLSTLQDDLTTINNKINILETKVNGNTASIEDLLNDIPNKLNIDELFNELQNTLPANTGTYILKAVDGVLSWELQT